MSKAVAFAKRDVALLPKVRGSLSANAPLKDYTWFRAGGPAEFLFIPADANDLASFLAARPKDLPVTVIGVGSNLLVRDGGIEGVVIRLGASLGRISAEPGFRIRAGAASLDVAVARAAADAGVAGLEFLRGIPGTIGGGLVMNAGAYGREFKDVLVEARGIAADGAPLTFTPQTLNMRYRHTDAPAGVIFTEALFQGAQGERSDILKRMEEITGAREATQPVKSRTGGSTFKNPDPHLSGGRKAWQLIDAAGCRGLTIGGAQVSELHCNFLINHGSATASDIERLGEEVRARVKAQSGIDLEWEIKRIGRTSSGGPLEESAS